MKRPFGRGPTTPLSGLTNLAYLLTTYKSWDDPPSIKEYPTQQKHMGPYLQPPRLKQPTTAVPDPPKKKISSKGNTTAMSDITLPETNSSHLKMDVWNTSFPLGWPIFRGYVSFLECSSTRNLRSEGLLLCDVQQIFGSLCLQCSSPKAVVMERIMF